MPVIDLLPSHFEPELAVRAWSTRQLARVRASWPGSVDVRWPNAGRLRLTLAGLATVDHQSTAGLGLCESFCLWRTNRQGRLDVDARFAVAVTSALLGVAGGGLPFARTLSPGERGMLGALVAAVFDEVAAPVQVALDVPDAVPLRLDVQAEADLRFTTDDGREIVGWARVFLPAAWLEGTGVYGPLLTPLPFAAAVEMARTRVDPQSWSAAREGDAIVFAGVPAVSDLGACDVHLSLGLMRAPARLADQGLTLVGPFAASPGWPEPQALPVALPASAWKGTHSMSTTIEMPPPGGAPNPEPSATLSQVLAATPLEVVAEVGRVVLTGAELAGLEQGMVLALGSGSRGAVTLSVSGRPVAKGVLVNIDGAFGVRVTERF